MALKAGREGVNKTEVDNVGKIKLSVMGKALDTLKSTATTISPLVRQTTITLQNGQKFSDYKMILYSVTLEGTYTVDEETKYLYKVPVTLCMFPEHRLIYEDTYARTLLNSGLLYWVHIGETDERASAGSITMDIGFLEADAHKGQVVLAIGDIFTSDENVTITNVIIDKIYGLM